MPVDKHEVIRAVASERRNIVALLRALDPTQFETEVLPRWRVREVAAHLVTTDIASLTGRILPLAFSPDTDRLERWNDREVPRWADRPIPELLVGLERWGRRFLALARAVPSPLYRATMPTLWGRGPGGLLIWARAYDEWVHRQDIRRGLGMETEQVDVAPAAEFMLYAAASQVLPQMERRKASIRVSLEGVPLPEWRYDVERGTAGPSTEAATATISAPGHAFVMAAAGRDPFDDLRRAGALRVEGDHDLASEFLARLRIV